MLDHSQTHFQKLRRNFFTIIKICDGILRIRIVSMLKRNE